MGENAHVKRIEELTRFVAGDDDPWAAESEKTIDRVFGPDDGGEHGARLNSRHPARAHRFMKVEGIHRLRKLAQLARADGCKGKVFTNGEGYEEYGRKHLIHDLVVQLSFGKDGRGGIRYGCIGNPEDDPWLTSEEVWNDYRRSHEG